MLHTKCREIGTSKGIIIPHNLLEHAHINVNDTLDVEYLEKEKAIVIKKSSAKSIRKGWLSAFTKLHASNSDELLIPDVFEDECFDETI